MGMQIPHPLVPGPHREVGVWGGGGGAGAGVTQENNAGGEQGAMQQMASSFPTLLSLREWAGLPWGWETPSPASGETSVQV